MTMSTVLLRKPFYRISELFTRWSVTESDIAAFVLKDELTLSIAVSQLPLHILEYEEVDDGVWCPIDEKHRFMSGTLDLRRDDAWAILTVGSAGITDFDAPRERSISYAPGGDDEPLHVEAQSLVVRRDELERFEQAQAAAASLPAVGASETSTSQERSKQRGAPSRYDVDAFWREVCRTVHVDGPPLRQGDLVLRLQQWFDRKLGSGNGPDESWIRKKIAPLWPDIAPEVRSERRAK
jgi:hypothetical protein